jgi:N-acetylglucosaminyl-diphospho-decaprenol L-rhamnosyltransferase
VSPERPRLAAVVVEYRSGDALRQCVAALHREGAFPVVVVDNGVATGRVRDVVPAGSSARARLAGWPVEVVDPPGNLGYGRAANLGARQAFAVAPAESLDGLVVVNPDLVLRPGALARLGRVLAEEPDVGIVGPALSGSDGRPYPTGRRFPGMLEGAGHALFGWVAPHNRFTRRYRMEADEPMCGRRRVDWVSGACLVVRRETWESLGGFDPGYFLYAEDVDLAWRAHRAGWAVVLEPGAEAIHEGGRSTVAHPWRRLYHHHRSTLRFLWRRTDGVARLVVLPAAAVLAVRAAAVGGQEALGRWRTARGRPL